MNSHCVRAVITSSIYVWARVPDFGPIARKMVDRQSNRSTFAQDKMPAINRHRGGDVQRQLTFSNLSDACCIIRPDDGSRGLLAHFVPVSGFNGPRGGGLERYWPLPKLTMGPRNKRAPA